MGARLGFLLAAAALAAACQLFLDTDKIAIPAEPDASTAEADVGSGAARDAGGESDAAGSADTGSADAESADAESADAGAANLEVAIVSPTGVAYVNAALSISVTVAGAEAAKVELLCDGAVFAELKGRPYSYTWDTAGLASGVAVPEGMHAVVARATAQGLGPVESAPVTVVVDRTPPTAQTRPLPPDDANVGVREPFQIVFSEPMSPDAASDQGVGISASCGSVAWRRALSADGKTLSIQPISAVSLPCTATASLGGACRDLAGNPAKPKTMTWTMPIWQRLGDAVSIKAGALALAVSSAGEPVVAYENAPGSPDAHVLVKRWSGGVWAAVGAALGTVAAASPALDLDERGAPTVAWVDGAAPRSLNVARLESGAWVSYPAAITVSGTKSADPSRIDVAVASDGSPWLAFQDAQTNWSMNLGNCVQSWDAASRFWVWRDCQAKGYGGGASLVLEAGDRPLLAYAWIDNSGLSVLSWNGTDWPSRGSTVSWGVEPSLAANAHGAVIAWRDRASNVDHVFAKVWDGADWAPRGTPSTLPSPLSFSAGRAPSTAVDASLGPVVAWLEPNVGFYVKHWNAGEWTLVGNALHKTYPFQSTLAYGPSLATDKSGGNLAIAWSQDSALYVMRLNR
jgi:hypothetical protein